MEKIEAAVSVQINPSGQGRASVCSGTQLCDPHQRRVIAQRKLGNADLKNSISPEEKANLDRMRPFWEAIATNRVKGRINLYLAHQIYRALFMMTSDVPRSYTVPAHDERWPATLWGWTFEWVICNGHTTTVKCPTKVD